MSSLIKKIKKRDIDTQKNMGPAKLLTDPQLLRITLFF